MKIRNKGSKIINIGTTILMPDASMDINEATLKLPAIQAFIAKGLLETDESEAAFQKAVEEAAARKLEEDAKVFSQKALKYDLVLVPGDSFGAPGYFRMAYCVDTEKVERSLEALRKFVKTEYATI